MKTSTRLYVIALIILQAFALRHTVFVDIALTTPAIVWLLVEAVCERLKDIAERTTDAK